MFGRDPGTDRVIEVSVASSVALLNTVLEASLGIISISVGLSLGTVEAASSDGPAIIVTRVALSTARNPSTLSRATWNVLSGSPPPPPDAWSTHSVSKSVADFLAST